MKPLEFEKRNRKFVAGMGQDLKLKKITQKWFEAVSKHEYSYHFKWMGRPIIQFPTDIIAFQEIVWDVQPDLIIETGIARGGSLIFYASMLQLLRNNAKVLGIDIDIREHNRADIERHPMFKRISMLEGSSVDPEIISKVYKFAEGKKRILVVLDSLHTHDHVLGELKAYSPLVKKGSYVAVLDTIIGHMPKKFSSNRPWGPDDNPATAVKEFLKSNSRFVVDKEIDNKLLISVAPGGYLKCVKN